jgi:hypothetical protein
MSRLFPLPERPPLRFAVVGDVSVWDPQREAVPEADIPRVRQIVLDDLRNAERTLAEAAVGPGPEGASHLRAIRTAIAKLETIVAPRPEN